MDRYAGKRFAGFILTMGCLMVGVMLAPVESFAIFSQTIGIVYGLYLAGQSATDHKTIAVNGSKS